MASNDEFWLDGARRRRSLGERLDRKLSRLFGAPAGKARRIVVHGGDGRTLSLDVPGDPGILYVATEVLGEDCYPTIPGIDGISTIVDIGANVGIAAARLRLAYPSARILCFEPNPAALAFLPRNAASASAELFAFGLGAQDARLPLYMGRDSSVTASLYQHHMTGTAASEVEIRAAGPALAAAGVTSIDLLKIDTEGAELPILSSLAPFLPAIRIVHLEFHSEPDRRAIQTMFEPTHALWAGRIAGRHAGQLTFVRADIAPAAAQVGG